MSGEGFVSGGSRGRHQRQSDTVDDATLLEETWQVTQGLDQMVLPVPGGPRNKTSRCSAEEVAGSQFEDGFAGKTGVEGPVEDIERLELAEAGGVDTALELAVVGQDEDLISCRSNSRNSGVAQVMGLGLV